MEVKLTVDVTPPVWTIDINPLYFEMESSYAELEVFQNDTAVLTFVITKNGLPLNLSGYSSRYRVKKAVGDASTIISKAGTTTDAAKGTLQVILSAQDLALAGTYTAQLSISLNGLTSTVIQYPLLIAESI